MAVAGEVTVRQKTAFTAREMGASGRPCAVAGLEGRVGVILDLRQHRSQYMRSTKRAGTGIMPVS